MKKQLSVAKFGGTSVANLDSINKCIDIIIRNPSIKIIVVSAQSGVTNLLDKLLLSSRDDHETIILRIHNIVRPIMNSVSLDACLYIERLFEELDILCEQLSIGDSLKINNQIMSFGEIVSSYLFTEILNTNNINAQYVDARKIIKTNNNFTKAKPLIKGIRTELEQHIKLESKSMFVVGGFIGSNKKNETTTLGRGGSDYTATLIAEAIRAKHIYIWTDVAGVYQADPRLLPSSKVIPEMSFKEAVELVKFGARVLHEDTLRPAIRSKMKVFVGSTFCPEKGGTWIINKTKQRKPFVMAITEKKNQYLITIKFPNYVEAKVVDNIYDILKTTSINVDIINITNDMIIFNASQINKNKFEVFTNNIKSLNNADVVIEHSLSLTTIIGNSLNKIPKLSNNIISVIDNANLKLSGHSSNGKSFCLLTTNNNTIEKVHSLLF